MVRDLGSSVELLERCPFCDYRLEGLPVEYYCPECGRPVDRRWRVYQFVRERGLFATWADPT